jgi:hypothetical protein
MLEPQLTERAIESPDKAPIFVIGSGRSGTTLLRQMLNAHPRIYIAHESAFYSYLRLAPRDVTVAQFLERYLVTFSFAWLRLDPQLVRDALPPNLTMDRAREIFQTVLRTKAQIMGKPRYGEKNPLDTQNLARIFADFPDARVIAIMRDPRPTVHSFNRMPFATSSKLLNAFMCRAQYQHLKVFSHRILEVRLEDLSASPKATMQSILNFVGEPWDDSVLDHVRRAQTDDLPPVPWFVNATQQGPSQRESGLAGREDLPPVWTRLIERVNRQLMQHYGYQTATLKQEPSLWDYVRAVAGDVRGMVEAAYRLLAMKQRLDRHMQGRKLLDPQREMEENLQLNPSAWRYYPEFVMPKLPLLRPQEDSATEDAEDKRRAG